MDVPLHPTTTRHDYLDLAKAKHARQDAELLELRAGYERLAGQHTLLHRELNTWQDEWLHHDLREALRAGNSSALSSITTRVEGAVDVYIIPLFSDAFMVLLEEELAHAQQQSHRLAWTRPNTMNHYGFATQTSAAAPCDPVLPLP